VQEMRKEDEFEKEMEKAKDENISEKERENTIKCLMKVMTYQLEGIKD
jgi:hypothetical protein